MHSERRVWWAVSAAVVVIYAVLVFINRYSQNIDSVAYINSARALIQGRFADTLTPYWSPLFSWCMAPLLYAGMEGWLAARVVIGVAALMVLFFTRRIARLLGIGNAGLVWLAVSSAPLVLYCAYTAVTPDLLMVACCLGYLTTLLRGDPSSVPVRVGLVAGAWAAAAYLSKTYALPLCIAHITLSAVYSRLRECGVSLRQWAAAAAVFAVVSCSWIGAISLKEGAPTIGTAASWGLVYDHYVRSHFPAGAQQKMLWLKPAAAIALEGYAYDKSVTRSGIVSLLRHGGVRWRAGLVLRNLGHLVCTYTRFTLLWWVILPAVFLVWRAAATSAWQRYQRYVLAGMFVLVPLGYLVTAFSERYIWLNGVLLALAGARIVDEMFRYRRGFPGRRLTALLLSASFFVVPAVRLPERPIGEAQIYRVSRELRERFGITSPVYASRDFWRTGLLAWHLNGSSAYYYIPPGDAVDEAKMLRDMQRAGIEYYLEWSDVDKPVGIFKQFPAVHPQSSGDLTIYALTPKKR